MKRRSKRYKALKELVKDKKVNSFELAIAEIKKMSNPILLFAKKENNQKLAVNKS